MGNKRIAKRRKKRKQKVSHSTSYAPLCALGGVLKEKAFFEKIHQTVEIPQKTIAYRPTDKLVFATLGIIAGVATISDINTVLRPHGSLLLAFEHSKCVGSVSDSANAKCSHTGKRFVNLYKFHAALSSVC